MPSRKKPKLSQEIEKETAKKQTTKYTFSFNQFELESLEKNKIKDFNNYYSNNEHFLRVNKCLFEVIKILSNETYKETVIDKKLVRTRHFKVLERPESRARINDILRGYGKSETTIKQWEENQYVEFGMTDEERFIGVILDYNIIAILYADPNHLTFPNANFDINAKMSYTVPASFSKSSTVTLNYYKAENILDGKHLKQEKMDLYELAIEDNINGRMTDQEFIEFCKSIYRGE